jgi:drug/metabolite transporter (DMT)-like permease
VNVRQLSAKTLGVLAVVGLVVAFSLSSTLVKRAESPGVLVAFWRLLMVSVLWNLVLAASGRRLTVRDARQVVVPGVFFGLNLAVFFAGATHNSVANAALIGSLAPFLIVPVGAWLFHESFDRRALAFALLAFGGLVLVLLCAPPNGDASLEGNVFGVLAMLLLVGYVASTRYFRREMDVTTFMSAICPIAAVTVLPVALARAGRGAAAPSSRRPGGARRGTARAPPRSSPPRRARRRRRAGAWPPRRRAGRAARPPHPPRR